MGINLARRKLLKKAALGAGFLLAGGWLVECLGEKTPDKPLNSAKAPTIEELIEEAIRDPSKRQTVISQIAHNKSYDQYATWNYCEDVESCVARSVAYDPKRHSIQYKEKATNFRIILEPRKLAQAEMVQKFQQDFEGTTAALTELHDDSQVGTGQKAHVYVLPRFFHLAKTASSQLAGYAFVLSALRHEALHALDDYKGFDLGNGLVVNQDTSPFFMVINAWDPLTELREYGGQLIYEHELLKGNYIKSSMESYLKEVVRCKEFLKNNKYPVLGNVRINETIERQLELHRQDPVLSKFF